MTKMKVIRLDDLARGPEKMIRFDDEILKRKRAIASSGRAIQSQIDRNAPRPPRKEVKVIKFRTRIND